MSYCSFGDVAAVIDVDDGDDLLAQISSSDMLINRCLLKVTPAYTTSELLEIGKYLAAHYYAVWKPRSKTQNVSGVSETAFDFKPGQGLRATIYGQQALALDTSGTLALMQNTLDKKTGTLPGGAPAFSIKWVGRRPHRSLVCTTTTTTHP